jgi:multicomponent Na+:H+ antiporter subunit E
MSRGILLVAIWFLAWGEVSVANALTGAAMAAVLLTAFPAGRDQTPTLRRVRPVPMARLVVHVVRQLVVSNVVMAARTLRRDPGFRPGVLAYPLDHPSDLVVTSITSIIALSPGTMTVDVTSDPTVLHVHMLVLDDVDAATRMIGQLVRLTCEAFGEGDHP